MSLEAAIAANTAAIEKQTNAIERLIASGDEGRKTLLTAFAQNGASTSTAPTATAEAPAADEKPKTTTKPKVEKPAAKTEEKSESAEITVETLDAKFRPWLAEFDKGHPERTARQAKFKEILGKLGAEKMSAIEDAGKLAKLDNWFETKAKTWDEGHGVGRFAADPEPAGDEAGDEDDL